jgi:KDO2-lipid IV(A) lauroyltransferase
MKKLQHSLEFYSLFIFASLIRCLPLTPARFIARLLADIVYYIIPIRRKVVVANLTAAFRGEKSDAEIRQIAHDNYRQFARTMMELLLFPRFSKDDLAVMVTFENLHLIEAAHKAGKGAVLVGAHFGNWELMGAALAQHYPVTFVVGQQQNTRVDDLLNSFRTGKGIKLIPLKFALRGVMKSLKNNEFIAILADQDAHEHGAFVPFFGRLASTPKGPAMFALRAGCPLIMGNIVRTGRNFKVIFDEIPRPASSGNDETDIENYTAAFTRILESYCRRYPDHWFWMHRRWKSTRPTPVSQRPS